MNVNCVFQVSEFEDNIMPAPCIEKVVIILVCGRNLQVFKAGKVVPIGKIKVYGGSHLRIFCVQILKHGVNVDLVEAVTADLL